MKLIESSEKPRSNLITDLENFNWGWCDAARDNEPIRSQNGRWPCNYFLLLQVINSFVDLYLLRLNLWPNRSDMLHACRQKAWFSCCMLISNRTFISIYLYKWTPKWISSYICQYNMENLKFGYFFRFNVYAAINIMKWSN